MNWECPSDWKYVPELKPASAGMIMGIIFNGDNRWQKQRNTWFRRCNASGKWIYPGRMMWVGVVTFKTPGDNIELVIDRCSYSVAYLTENEYLVQKLKRAI